MTLLLEERSLAERLQRRIEIEQQFARTGRRFRNKSFLFRHEDIFIAPFLKLGLKLTGLYSQGIENAITPVVRKLTLHFPDLPSAFDGFEILHMSDLHIDGVDGLTEAVVSQLEGLRPDVCVMTGDYRYEDDGPCDAVYPRMRSILASISAKYGVFGILGNHDISEIALALEEMGMRMLVNEAVEITKGNGSLWLGGIDDPFEYRCDDLPATFSAVPPDGFKILLAHTPQLYKDASDLGVNVYLCGHTHAGQFRFPMVGSVRHNADCPKTYSYGHWVHDALHGYTTAGLGCSMLPIRFNCPPELVLITLQRQ